MVINWGRKLALEMRAHKWNSKWSPFFEILVAQTDLDVADMVSYFEEQLALEMLDIKWPKMVDFWEFVRIRMQQK